MLPPELTPESLLIVLALIALGGAGLGYVVLGLSTARQKVWFQLFQGLLAAGGLCLMAALAMRSVAAGFLALSNMYESVLAVSTGMALTLAVLAPRMPTPWVGAVAVWGMVGLVAFGLTLPHDIQPLQAALRSYWRAIHVPVILLSYALFTLNFATTVVQRVQVALAAPPPLSSTGERTALAEFAAVCVAIGFPLLTVGVILGGVWANEAWGTYWNWDPKESMALATLLAYGVYLHLNLNTEASQTVLDWVAIAAFALLLVAYFGVNLMGVGLHSYGAFN